MCLAIYKPADKKIPVDHIKNGFESNSDGAGIAWAQDGKIHVNKGVWQADALIGLYQEVEQYPCLIHCRKKTHGEKNDENCHPFVFCDGKYALIHNGVIPIKPLLEGLSDTATFVKTILEPLVKDLNVPIDHPALAFLVKEAIGTDKIVVMDGDGKVVFFNEDKGTLEGGVWYSNCSFRYGGRSKSTWQGSSYYSGGSGPSSSTYGPSGSEKDSTPNYSHSPITTQSRLPGNKIHAGSWNGEENDTDICGIVESPLTMDVKTGPKKQGDICEYGWYDSDIETEIESYQKLGLTRLEALIRCFNNV
jgi:hypothetical protein